MDKGKDILESIGMQNRPFQPPTFNNKDFYNQLLEILEKELIIIHEIKTEIQKTPESEGTI